MFLIRCGSLIENPFIQVRPLRFSAYFASAVMVKCIESWLLLNILGRVLLKVITIMNDLKGSIYTHFLSEILENLFTYTADKLELISFENYSFFFILFLMIFRYVLVFISDFLFLSSIDKEVTEKCFKFFLFKISANYLNIDEFAHNTLSNIGFKTAMGLKSFFKLYATEIANLIVFGFMIKQYWIFLYVLINLVLKVHFMKKSEKFIKNNMEQIPVDLDFSIRDIRDMIKKNIDISPLQKNNLFFAIFYFALPNMQDDMYTKIMAYLLFFFYNTDTLQYEKNFDKFLNFQIYTNIFKNLKKVNKTNNKKIFIKKIEVINFNKFVLLPSLEEYGIYTQLFDNLNLTVHQNEKVMIYSEKRSGKTVLLQNISNLNLDLNKHVIKINDKYDYSAFSNKRCLFLDANSNLIYNDYCLLKKINIYSGIKNISVIKEVLNLVNFDLNHLVRKNYTINLSKTETQKIMLAIGILNLMHKKIDLLLIDDAILHMYSQEKQQEILKFLYSINGMIILSTKNKKNLENDQWKQYNLFDKTLHDLN